jgi:pyruvate kinase
MIVAFSEGGTTARLVSKYRPCCPVLLVTSNAQLAKHCSALFGMYPMLLPARIINKAHISKAVTK